MLTIITVVRDDMIGLQATQASIAAQTITNYEWLVIDGASSDGTVGYLHELSETHRQLRFVSESDGGIYDAMQKGLINASNPFVLFLNAGDTLANSDSLSVIYTALTQRNVDVFFFAVEMTSRDFVYVRKPRPLSSATYSVPANQQGTVYLTEALVRIPWPTGFRICGDMYISAQLLRNHASYVCTDIVVSKFQLGGVSTLRPVQLALEAWQVQRKVLGCSIFYCLRTGARRLATGVLVLVLHSSVGVRKLLRLDKSIVR